MSAKPRRDWRRVQANSLRNAMELCKQHALDKKNLSVERIAEEMGIADHWSLYKWIANGRMPAVLIPAYESVCGINFVSRWLASRHGNLLIPIPSGRDTKAADVQRLQEVLSDATGALIKFHSGQLQAEEVITAIRSGLEGLAWHHHNVTKHQQPELEL